jgi:hypothetical protein
VPPARPDRAAGAPAAAARPLRGADLWVSAAAVRQAIGAWAYTRAGGEPHPGDDVVRAAVGVACAIAELAADAARTDAPWAGAGADGPGDALTGAVAADPARLADLAGVSARDAERALAVLDGAGLVRRGGADARVALVADALAPLPTVARLAWPEVRRRLAAAGAGVGAPLAVLRAVAERVGAVDLAGGMGTAPPVRASVRDLEDATRFGRSTVSEAVAALVRARVLDADTRAGHTGRFVLRPPAFGLSDPDPEPVAPPAGARVAPAGPPPPAAYQAPPRGPALAGPATVGSPPVGSAPGGQPAPAGAPVLVGTFAGTPIYAPAGTPLVVECDADGRWVCRVGPFLQLGPVAAP